MKANKMQAANSARYYRWGSLFPIKTLDDGLKCHNDNFLLLRFLAACMVIYRHGGAITGGSGFWDIIPWLGWGTDSGKIAVHIFFIVSGFMVTGSYMRRNNLSEFLWARLLRIFPAYIFCLVLSSLVLGAIYTTESMHEYYMNHGVYHYIFHNMSMQTNMVWKLPGVFIDNPKRATINGSIWTLPAESRMYLWVALVGLSGLLSRRWLATTFIVAMLIIGVVRPHSALLMTPDIYLELGGMFALGAICYIHRDRITVGWLWVLILAISSYSLRSTEIYPYIFAATLAQFCFSFAYSIPWYWFNRFGDYSYGIYLWGFPMQQVIAHEFPNLTPIENSLTALPLALTLAVISWHLIEKQALRMKILPAQFMLTMKMKMRNSSKKIDTPSS